MKYSYKELQLHRCVQTRILFHVQSTPVMMMMITIGTINRFFSLYHYTYQCLTPYCRGTVYLACANQPCGLVSLEYISQVSNKPAQKKMS